MPAEPAEPNWDALLEQLDLLDVDELERVFWQPPPPGFEPAIGSPRIWFVEVAQRVADRHPSGRVRLLEWASACDDVRLGAVVLVIGSPSVGAPAPDELALLDSAMVHDDPSVRACALAFRFRWEPLPQTELLNGALQDRSVVVRVAALEALSGVEPAAAIAAARARLVSGEELERAEAAEILGRTGDHGDAKRVGQLAKEDPSELVRRAAASALEWR